ncbi:Uncharacterised protein g6910 [Pycnogonum litorale]
MNERCLRRIPRLGVWLALTSGTLFGVSTVLAALIIDEIGAETLITLRYLLLVVVTAPFLVKYPETLAISWKCYFYIVISGICTVTTTILAYQSLFYIPPLDVSTLVNTQPFFSLILASCFLKEAVTVYDLSCVTIIIGGVVLVVQPEFIFDSTVSNVPIDRLWGCGLAVLSALTCACIGIIVRFFKEVNCMLVLFIQGTTATVLLLCFYSDKMTLPTTAYQITMIVCVSIIVLFGRLSSNVAYQNEDAGVVGSSETVEIICSAVLQIYIIHEIPNYLTITGTTIMIVSICVLSLKSKIKKLAKNLFQRSRPAEEVDGNNESRVIEIDVASDNNNNNKIRTYDTFSNS